MPRLLLSLLILACGATSALAVVGGRDAQPGEVPSIVALVLNERMPNAYEAQFCAGTLVAPDRVLTAAHCVFYANGTPLDVTQVGVLAGVNTLNTNEAIPPVGVAAITANPGWNPLTKQGTDLAVLSLAQPVTVIAPLPVAGPGQALSWLAGRPAIMMGWGATLPDSGSTPQLYPQVLQIATSPFVADATCRLMQGSVMSPGSICVGDPDANADACTGDSGGPLIGNDPTNGAQVLVGAVSSGVGCRQKFHPGIYAMTAPTADWLRSLGVPVGEGASPPGSAPRATALPAQIATGRMARLWWRSTSRVPASEDIIITSARSGGKIIAWKRTTSRAPRTANRLKSVSVRLGGAWRGKRLLWCVVPTNESQSGAASCARLTVSR